MSIIKKINPNKGYAVIDISKQQVLDMFGKHELGEGSITGLVLADGREVLTGTEEESIFSNLTHYNDALSDVEHSEQYYETINGTTYLFLYSKVEEANATVCTLIPKDTILKQVENIKKLNVIYVSIACIFAVLMVIFIAGGVSKAISSLMKSISQASKGDLTAKFETKSHDEFRVLSDGISNMIISMRKLIGEVQEVGSKVNTSAGGMYDTSEELLVAAKDISQTIDDIEKGVVQQASDTEQCLLQMSGLSEQINHVYKGNIEGEIILDMKIQSGLIKKLLDGLEIQKTDALNEFWRSVEVEQTPLIEPIDNDSKNMLVTVVWKDTGDIYKVSVIGEFFGFNSDESVLNRIQDTNVWYRSFVCPNDVRSLYCFTINDDEADDWGTTDIRIDLFNPKQYHCPKDEKHPESCALISKIESILEMPKAIEKIYIKQRDGIEKGKIELYQFDSKILNNSRRVWVYTPANYNENELYGIALFLDGWEYINIIKAPTIIDNLIDDHLIPPICSVFIDTSDDRDNELACNKTFTEFLVTEILPWIHKGYSVTNDAQNTILAGYSFGALAACYGAFIHPEKFGKVLGQSGGFSWKPEGEEDGWIIREYIKSSKLPIDFYLDIGSFELKWPFVSKAMQEITNVLRSKGYHLKYNIFTGGHVQLDWQDTLADGLVYLTNKN